MSNFSSKTTNRWMLPEGIEELLPYQAERLEKLRRGILDLFHSWGYELVITPLAEYMESLLVGVGSDLDLETNKLIDQLTGRLMGVRADMTPQVARIDAHRLNRNTPVRLCYLDAVLRTQPHGFTRTRSPVQVGAELYGHAGVDSDIEMLCLMIEMLRITGLNEFHVDLGHVGIFKALARSAQLNDEQESILFDALQRKARPEIESFLSDIAIDKKYSNMIISLVELNGGEEVFDSARDALKKGSKEVREALDRLESLVNAAQSRLNNVKLHYDLAELRGYGYQNGIVFAAFMPGYGQEIARGGRYDGIGKVFGRSRPATGFSSDLNTLMELSPIKYDKVSAIAAPDVEDETLAAFVSELRKKGERVIYILPGQTGTAAEIGCQRTIEKIDGKWQVK